METNWAAEHLQVIRTLMERSAVYRRALAPMMIFIGVVGVLAAGAGILFKIAVPQAFIAYWACVALLALAGSFLLVRRQALKESEPFWSPPTRRVTHAMMPALVGGCIISAVVFFTVARQADQNTARVMLWLPLGWVVLYGCGFHAAGFFMPRGMRLFGWVLMLGACLAFALGLPDHLELSVYAHGIMGFFFGLLHLAYGVYIYFTDQRRNET